MKVCITTAGLGTRMGEYACINKALLPVNGVAAISHIINSFRDADFVIALGHLGEQVRDYIAIAHPTISCDFIEVPCFEGPGTGPLRSLYECRKHLRQPFYFVSCDTLFEKNDWDNDRNLENIAYFGVPEWNENPASYSHLGIDNTTLGLVVLGMSGESEFGYSHPFTGLLKIADFDAFWDAARGALEKGDVEIFHAVNRFLESHVVHARALPKWRDIGTKERYEWNIIQTCNFDFSKPNEFLYTLRGEPWKVVKWFADSEITEKRVARARLRPDLFPHISDHRNGFFAYDFVNGRTLYERNSVPCFKEFLSWAYDNLWQEEQTDASEAMKRFYIDKTQERLALFRAKYPTFIEPRTVNEEPVLPMDEILKRVDLSAVSSMAIPAFIHGDLHFDHIIRTDGGFKLIDWRQDFGGRIDVGDIYYDLAKLLGGIRLNYHFVKENLFSYEEKGPDIRISVVQEMMTGDYERELLAFIRAAGFDARHTEIVLGLIYLNMSPLHKAPFDTFLYALAQRTLTKALG